MSVARNIPDGCSSLKAGKWERSRLVGVEVKGKTLGIIGLGKGILHFQVLSSHSDQLSRYQCGTMRYWTRHARRGA